MPAHPAATRVLEIEAEKRLLLKAQADIENGWWRLRNQQGLLTSLKASGHNTSEAERLVWLMESTLIEWERHRLLIEHRIAYLQDRNSASGRE
jgi:hypothetical protein